MEFFEAASLPLLEPQSLLDVCAHDGRDDQNNRRSCESRLKAPSRQPTLGMVLGILLKDESTSDARSKGRLEDTVPGNRPDRGG